MAYQDAPVRYECCHFMIKVACSFNTESRIDQITPFFILRADEFHCAFSLLFRVSLTVHRSLTYNLYPHEM